MKTKTKPKPTKSAKIKQLQKKAANRAHINKKSVKKASKQHFISLIMAVAVTVCTGGLAFAITSNLNPTPLVQVELPNLERALAANRPVNAPEPAPDQVGQASWYAVGLRDPSQLTCASTTYPRGTYLMVKNKHNGKSVICLVDDYGPASFTGRVIDLSRGSFSVIENLGAGTTQVEIRVVPAPAASLNLPIPRYLGQITGYDLCRQHHTSDYCEGYRRLKP